MTPEERHHELNQVACAMYAADVRLDPVMVDEDEALHAEAVRKHLDEARRFVAAFDALAYARTGRASGSWQPPATDPDTWGWKGTPR